MFFKLCLTQNVTASLKKLPDIMSNPEVGWSLDTMNIEWLKSNYKQEMSLKKRSVISTGYWPWVVVVQVCMTLGVIKNKLILNIFHRSVHTCTNEVNSLTHSMTSSYYLSKSNDLHSVSYLTSSHGCEFLYLTPEMWYMVSIQAIWIKEHVLS